MLTATLLYLNTMRANKIFLGITLVCIVATAFAQTATYHPCFLMDSTDKHLSFVQQNVKKVFNDTMDCRQQLLTNVAKLYNETKNKKYLDALLNIRAVGGDLVSGLYPDAILIIVQNSFSPFLNDLYSSRGKYYNLEKELIVCMNMIVEGRQLRQKYMGLLNVEISKTKDKKDTYKTAYLEKLKTKIEEEKY